MNNIISFVLSLYTIFVSRHGTQINLCKNGSKYKLPNTMLFHIYQYLNAVRILTQNVIFQK